MKHNKKWKAAIIAICLLSVTVLGLGIYAAAANAKAEKYKLQISNNYQHAFDELVTAVGEMDSALQKSIYAVSPALSGAVCTEIFGKAMTAQMSLGVLPFSTYELEQTAGFISRVGDYAFALSRAAAAGESLGDEQRENLKALAESSALLRDNMKNLQRDMMDGVLTMDELYKSEKRIDAAEESLPSTIGESMRLIEQEFPELPSLIYDGPFSNHLSDKSPALLENTEEIDENKGREVAAHFLQMPKTKVFPVWESDGELPCYVYQTELSGGETQTVAVTKQGGQVLSMLSSDFSGGENLEIEDALGVADEFLLSRGYRNMEKSYYMLQDGILTANYAYTQGDVTCYPDLIKLSVDMGSGEICGFEALGYISSHKEREIAEAQVSLEEASAAVPEELQVESNRLAVIPNPGGEEVLCYEFVCVNEEEQRYIIYVDAISGEQEKILILLEDENGSLTL
ncbi:MAG: germination protein YpeB [Ruminococcaceae bacterium]|nr:germination protein YpeB [Oscillospiraceae bacterium]